MYYIICDGTVVNSSSNCPSCEELQQWANDLDAHAYVIKGEHTGMTADPDSDEDEDVEEA